MIDLDGRLQKCFAVVFPTLPSDHISTATLDTVLDWDSIATATLLSVIAEEFSIAVDFEAVEELTSYASIRAYVSSWRRD